MASLTITLAGAPQGKGRARGVLRAGRIGHYTPAATRSYEAMVRSAAMDALAGRPPLDLPLQFDLRAVFPVPGSWSERKRQKALAGEIKPAKRPDLDNIAKTWNDALIGVVYRDDALIVQMSLVKRYGPRPLVTVTVTPMETAVRITEGTAMLLPAA
jgi:Holliday junction resolvase RusA-like endonuclease